MPDRIALRKIRLRPRTCSRPGGHGATISHSRATTSTRTTTVQIGWRVLRFCKVPMLPAVATCLFDRIALPAAADSLMISPIWARWKQIYGSLGGSDLGTVSDCALGCDWRAIGAKTSPERNARSSPDRRKPRAHPQQFAIACNSYCATYGEEARRLPRRRGAQHHSVPHGPPQHSLMLLLATTILDWACVASGPVAG